MQILVTDTIFTTVQQFYQHFFWQRTSGDGTAGGISSSQILASRKTFLPKNIAKIRYPFSTYIKNLKFCAVPFSLV